ncbi:cytochrome P450 87A3-like [Triticum dicoccoides]|uniref:cytochrome P450 87A3-like n=1 Tax=Triticum dicoccoides TaxID=85692 RepID=UPI00188FB319|nr:cytochrome P450 87A3-like [Triticum dicoccoides]
MESYSLSYASLCGLAVVVAGWLLHCVYKWRNPPCNIGRLPPGSMGFPLVGETFQFLRPSPSLDIPAFYKQRLERYGRLFKTNLVGHPVVVSMDAEVNRFIFQQEGKLFRSWYPDTANSIFGKDSMVYYDGSVHKYVRSFAARLFGIDSLRDVLFAEMEHSVTQNLAVWATEPFIEVKDAVATMIFDHMAKKLIGFGPDKSRKLRKNFDAFFQGMVSFPLYFPGTTFYGCIQGRKKLQNVLKDLLKERLSTPQMRHGDFLDEVVDELRSGTGTMNEKFAVDFVAALLFGTFATISSALAVGMKLLSDHPNVVESLKEEHEAILKKREDGRTGITWDEYKSMTFTAQVTNEIVRISNVSPGIFRKALTDVPVKGYTIPAGWLVMISPMAIHLNPELYEDPLTFNPWRWQDESKKSTLLKNFMPFGGGTRHCVGAEFSKIQIAIFLHTLVTNYRWKEIKGGDVQRITEVVFPTGYHIQIIPREG